MTVIRTLTVNDNEIRLDKYIKRFFPNLTQSVIEKSLRRGLIKVNDQMVKSNYRVSHGENIIIKYIDNVHFHSEYKTPELKPNTKLIKLLQENILYEDDYIVAINKPAGIIVQGGKNSVSDVLDYIKSEETLKMVHRIDRDTSGIIIFARNAAVAKYLMGEFKTRTINKTYLSLTVGIPDENNGIINCPLVKRYVAGQEKVIVDINSSLNAVTHFSILEKLNHNVAFLKLTPITGRTHQLRVHLAHINCPILGDGKYGGRKAFINGIVNKMHLHAHSLSLKLPNNRKIVLTAPISQHIKQSIEIFSSVHVAKNL
ncbi:RNA pseudouridine synthase [Wolbachia pipientis]|uniref:Pseudouridine synthase n=1 Tax=Wolbachia pipientis TaxID=955 RepID=A0A1E7QL21_WOLPI|nr:RluA family pseudouridine synthase [Wolbachia pipientis]OEY87175.1 RNA pseudouridine synthase [Wolbachia pipientis]